MTKTTIFSEKAIIDLMQNTQSIINRAVKQFLGSDLEDKKYFDYFAKSAALYLKLFDLYHSHYCKEQAADTNLITPEDIALIRAKIKDKTI